MTTTVAALAVASFLAITFLPEVVSFAAEQPGVKMVGRWKPSTLAPGRTVSAATTGTQLAADPQARLLYAWDGNAWLAVYDLDTLKPRGPGLQSTGIKTVAVADPISGTLLVGLGTRPQGTSRLAQFALQNGAPRELGSFDTSLFLGPGQEILGIYRAPDRPVVWLLSAIGSGAALTGTPDVVITELEIPDNRVSRAVHRWSKRITGCGITMHTIGPIPVALGYVPAQEALYFGCGNTGIAAKNAPVVRGAARLVLRPGATPNSTTPSDPEFYPTPGGFSAADSFFDPVSGRLLFTTLSAGINSVVFFDSLTNSYVGSFGAGGNTLQGGGLDPVSGRFYGASADSRTGLLVTDVRATPARQGYAFPQYSTLDGKGPVAHAVVTDPVTGLVMLKYSGDAGFAVMQDTIPWYAPLEEDDPDRSTIDVPEDPARTTALFSAAAQGYGSRHRQIGGIAAPLENYAGAGSLPYPVGPGTRELRTSYLNGLTVSNGEAGASVITADRDRQNTSADSSKLPQGDPWPYEPVHCVDFGTEPSSAREGTSSVRCEAASVRAEAETLYDRGNAGGVEVSRSSLRAAVRRDSVKGALSTVNVRAEGISVLGGVLQIGDVTATAQAVAKGRPGTAKGTWTRTVSNVSLGGELLCEKDCDTEELAKRVNSQLVGRVRIDFPKPDPTFFTGSPGGYQALVRRAPFEQFQEQAFNGQPPDRIEVPAMVVTVFQDDTRAGRTIVELAATEAEARYGIALLGDDGSGGGGGGGGDASATGGAFGHLNSLPDGSPVFGLDPTAPAVAGRIGGLGSPAGDIGGDLASAGGILWNGLKGMLDLLPVWAVLLLPVYLSARRWLLLQRDALVTGGTS